MCTTAEMRCIVKIKVDEISEWVISHLYLQITIAKGLLQFQLLCFRLLMEMDCPTPGGRLREVKILFILLWLNLKYYL